jgi:molybdenum cofactor guanylyltransferase
VQDRITAGYVLVGGLSSRMGRDKALLPYRGGLLGASVAEVVRSAAGSCVLVGDPQRYRALGISVIPDLYPGEGPLGGILTALRHTGASWNLVTACDMPGLSPAFVQGLFEAAIRENADILMPYGPAGHPEPLCAVYHVRSLVGLEAAFAAGTRKISQAASGLRTVGLRVAELAPLENVNTPEDWSPHAAE